MMRSSSGGAAGLTLAGGTGSWCRIASKIKGDVAPGNARRAVAIS